MTASQLATASDLWSAGYGTNDIARLLGLQEWQVWNRMDAIRAKRTAA